MQSSVEREDRPVRKITGGVRCQNQKKKLTSREREVRTRTIKTTIRQKSEPEGSLIPDKYIQE